MTLQQHLLATGAVAAMMTPFAGVAEVVSFSVGSVLIDVDHYLFYLQRTGRYDVAGMFRYFKNVDRNLAAIPYLGVCIFHTVEFFLLIAILSFFFPLFKYLFCGLVFHLLLDIISLVRLRCPFIRAYSLLEHLVRRKSAGYPFF